VASEFGNSMGIFTAILSPRTLLLFRPVAYELMPQPLSCQYGKQQCYIRMDLYESTGVVGAQRLSLIGTVMII